MSKFLLLVALLLTLTSCGTETGTGYTGGPTGEAVVTLKSPAFSTSFSAVRLDQIFAMINPVTNFKFCVRKVKFENELGDEVKKDGVSDLEMQIGLVDVSTGAAKTWGSPSLPVGYTMSRMKVIVEKDVELCGITDAIQFNAHSTEDNVEIVWDFSPNVAVNSADILLLSLSTVVNALRTADNAALLNDGNLRSYVQASTNSGSKE